MYNNKGFSLVKLITVITRASKGRSPASSLSVASQRQLPASDLKSLVQQALRKALRAKMNQAMPTSRINKTALIKTAKSLTKKVCHFYVRPNPYYLCNSYGSSNCWQSQTGKA